MKSRNVSSVLTGQESSLRPCSTSVTQQSRGSRSTVSQGRSACGQATFNLRNNGPKGTKNDAGSSDTPKRSCEVLPLGEKVKVLNFIEDGKDSPIREPVKREKEMCATFAAASGAAQVTVSV